MTTPASELRRLKDLVQDANDGIATITNVVISSNGEDCLQLNEGQWIRGRFDRNIRLDQPTHMRGAGQNMLTFSGVEAKKL